MSKSFEGYSHLYKRCQQRGYRIEDIQLILEVGEITRDGVVLRNKNVEFEIRQRKKEIQQLERLSGTLVILNIDEGIVKTAYRAGKKKIRYQTYR